MAYFNYHSKIKRLVEQGNLKSYWFCNSYKNMGFVLILNFGEKTYPIREHKFNDYFDLIGRFYSTKKVGEHFHTTFLKN